MNYSLCTHVDNFLFGRIQFFLSNLMPNPFIGAEHCAAFKYLRLTINQSNNIKLYQIDYFNSLEYIDVSNKRKKQKEY